MSQIILCVPALLPLAGGMVILFAGLSASAKKRKNPFEDYRKLELYVEGLTVLNSLILAWLILGGGQGEVLCFSAFTEI